MIPTGREASRPGPYRGLNSYTEEDAYYFFGRSRERQLITAHLQAHRLTLLYGPTGVGKSSVLRAGVAADLLEDAWREKDELRTPEFLPVVFSAWGDDPLAAIVESIRLAVLEFLPSPSKLPESLSIAETIETGVRLSGARLLVILDQFEEYFLYRDRPRERSTFAQQFAHAVRQPGLAAGFLVSIREDKLAELDRFQHDIPTLFDHYLRIGRLHRSAAREAIERPLTAYNARHDDDQVDMEPRLIDAILDQVGAATVEGGDSGSGRGDGGEAIEAPYLQLVLERLWTEEVGRGSRRLHLTTLAELGGAETIVRTHLDAALDELSQAEQDIAVAIFDYLVTPSRTKIAHDVQTLASYTERSPEEVEALIDKLSLGNTRILRAAEAPVSSSAPARYQIFHDILVEAIVDWRKRQLEERGRLRAQQELADKSRRDLATRWKKDGADIAGSDSVGLENVALLHTSFRYPKDDERFRGGLAYYRIHIIVMAPEPVMRRIRSVTYHLDPAYPPANRIHVSSDRGSRFKMKELANGTSIVTATIDLEGRDEPLELNRFIDLRPDGPRL